MKTDVRDRGRIVLSINSAWNVFNFRAGLIAALRGAGWRVVVLAPDDGYGDKVRAMGVDYVDLPIARRGLSPVRDLRLLWRYWRLLARIRPAAYLGYTIKPNVWGSIAAQARGVPVINNVAGLGETFLAPGPLNRLVRLLYRLALARSRVIFFQNGDDRALFTQLGLVDPAKVRLLPGSGIDTQHFAVAPLPSARPFTFLLVARLLVAKGIGEYAEAARVVRQRYPGTRFQLLGLAQEGRGAVDPAALHAWQAEGLIELLPPTDDVRPVLAGAHCVVLPTAYPEGTPRSLLEAASMGRPLIATDASGCRDVVRDGENGFLVPAREAPALAAAMERMLALSDDERAQLGRASRALIERSFAEQRVTDAYRAALDDVTRAPV